MSSYLFVRSAGSCLNLEVISGPSKGLHFSQTSTSTSKPQVTLGRLSPCHISLLTDSEVSGKHALISWNSNVLVPNLFYFQTFLIDPFISLLYLIKKMCLPIDIKMGIGGYGQLKWNIFELASHSLSFRTSTLE